MNKEIKSSELQLPLSFNKLISTFFITGILGLLISIIYLVKDSHHFYFSYLNSFTFYLTLTLGGMFIVLLSYLTRSGWNVVIRRVPEHLMKNVGIMALFCIPIFFGMHDLYHWTHLEDVLNDHILQGKRPYLNIAFFVLRIFVYFGVWAWISRTFFNKSIEQDESGDPEITLSLQKKSTYSMILFALTLSFASIDFVMSLTPHWYSTIFGIYIFAGAVLVAFTVTSLVYMYLRSRGILNNVISIEHYHDLGKLMYGFNIFWSYIAFSQFFLIWYGNIPEEIIFYQQHFNGSWNNVAAMLSIGHFGIPFVFFMSRHAKRNLSFHAIMGVWLILMHILDLYWIIMPTVSPDGIHISVADFSTFIGIGGIYFAVLFNGLKKVSLIPKKDPRLDESLKFENI